MTILFFMITFNHYKCIKSRGIDGLFNDIKYYKEKRDIINQTLFRTLFEEFR